MTMRSASLSVITAMMHMGQRVLMMVHQSSRTNTYTHQLTQAQDILMRGEAVQEEMVATMLNDKINSPEVEHYGNFKRISFK